MTSPIKTEICVLRKSNLLRGFSASIFISVAILVYVNANMLSVLLIIPLFISIILIQVMEKVEITGSMLFDDKKIIIQEGETESVMDYRQIKNIKIKGANIKGDFIFWGGPLFVKRGHRNKIIIHDVNDIKYQYRILLNSELQYRVLKRKIDEISNGLENKTQPCPPNPPVL
jgi:hypothetical protein